MVTIIDYRGKKALFIDTKDIIEMNTRIKSNTEMDLIAELETANQEVDCILLVTSIDRSHWPKWLRNILLSMPDNTVPCYRYFFVNDHLINRKTET